MIHRKNQASPDIIVVGGGAAGLMAAGRAAERGAKVILVEKTHRLGNKLLLTGGGRCNITHKAGLREFVNAFGKNGRFLYRAFTAFSNHDLIQRKDHLPQELEERNLCLGRLGGDGGKPGLRHPENEGSDQQDPQLRRQG